MNVTGMRVAAGVVVVLLAASCGAWNPTGIQGRPEEGSSSFVVTYRPSAEDEPIRVDIAMDATDCYVVADRVFFGEDVSLEYQLEHKKFLNEQPTASAGYYAGAVSGVRRERLWPSLSIVLPGELLYVSHEPFEMVDGSFSVEDHVGRVAGGGPIAVGDVVDEDARATGSFTCGRVTRQ